MKEKLSKVVNVVKKIPDKKHHLDFLAAALTIPVLISDIILNYSSLQKLKKPSSPQSVPTSAPTQSAKPQYLIINYSNTNYCSVVWSYSINNGAWSDSTSNNPCIYNLQNGNIKFDLRVQSTVTQNITTLTRNFIYQGQKVPTPSTPFSSTQSAALN